MQHGPERTASAPYGSGPDWCLVRDAHDEGSAFANWQPDQPTSFLSTSLSLLTSFAALGLFRGPLRRVFTFRGPRRALPFDLPGLIPPKLLAMAGVGAAIVVTATTARAATPKRRIASRRLTSAFATSSSTNASPSSRFTLCSSQRAAEINAASASIPVSRLRSALSSSIVRVPSAFRNTYPVTGLSECATSRSLSYTRVSEPANSTTRSDFRALGFMDSSMGQLFAPNFCYLLLH